MNIKKSTLREVLREEHCGSRKGRLYVGQIFTLRLIIEK